MPDSLIPRAHLFGNPNRSGGAISPDGLHLAWVAPLEGVMNVWVAPLEAPDEARPVTHDAGRGVPNYYWAYDGQRLVFLQDSGGDENWRLHAGDVRATPAGSSRRIRGEMLVSLNRREGWSIASHCTGRAMSGSRVRSGRACGHGNRALICFSLATAALMSECNSK